MLHGLWATVGLTIGTTAGVIAGVVVGILALWIAETESLYTFVAIALSSATVGLIGGIVAGISVGIAAEDLFRKNLGKALAIGLSLPTVTAATGVGVGLTIGFAHSLVLTVIISSSSPIVLIAAHQLLKQLKALINRRTLQQHLIKP